MQSSIYHNRSGCQPRTPCSRDSHVRKQAALLRSQSRQQRALQHLSCPQSFLADASLPRSSGRVHAVEQQHGMFSYDDVHPQHQHQQQIQPPEWHPRLFGLQDSKRDALEHSARLYYDEVWGAGSVDLLDELTTAGVCFNDALGMEADAFSRASLKAIISEFQASHPLLKYEVEGVLVDDVRNTVVVQYTVTAAQLLPQEAGAEPTGHVSVVSGMDKIMFDRSGLISSILSFRQRFMEEEAEPINWDTV